MSGREESAVTSHETNERCIGLMNLGVLAVLLLAAGGGQAVGQVTGENGAELFVNYCASCHGVDGKGRGPTAVALKIRPADLTTIAKRNGGTFPKARIRSVIWGPDNLFIPAHGSSQMPVWGPTFRALDPMGDNERRLSQLIAYLEFLQSKD